MLKDSRFWGCVNDIGDVPPITDVKDAGESVDLVLKCVTCFSVKDGGDSTSDSTSKLNCRPAFCR